MSNDAEMIFIDTDRCVQCESCIEECPHDALEIGAGGLPCCIDNLCIRCGECIEICPVMAISFDEN